MLDDLMTGPGVLHLSGCLCTLGQLTSFLKRVVVLLHEGGSGRSSRICCPMGGIPSVSVGDRRIYHTQLTFHSA